MTAIWQTRLTDVGARLGASLLAGFGFLSRPDVFPRFRRLTVILLALWLLVSLWRAAWSFLPETQPLPSIAVINPVIDTTSSSRQENVDIDSLVAARLFGQPGSTLSPEDIAAASGRSPAMSEEEAATALAGIEDGAPDTGLPLLLRGVVAASEAGLGQAVIENRKLQDLYQVGDELPVNGDVTLAKVMPDLVVLDNGGRYEVLRLFEESSLSRQAEQLRSSAASNARASNFSSASGIKATDRPPVSVSGTEEAAEVAARYREQLYENPESLAEVARISAVREGDELLGYRVSPGKAANEFRALGFRSGDIVTAVNGLSLSEPANTVRLYQAMRSARSASFELQRDGETVILDVDIGGGGG